MSPEHVLLRVNNEPGLAAHSLHDRWMAVPSADRSDACVQRPQQLPLLTTSDRASLAVHLTAAEVKEPPPVHCGDPATTA
jgi:hypothetical protein